MRYGTAAENEFLRQNLLKTIDWFDADDLIKIAKAAFGTALK